MVSADNNPQVSGSGRPLAPSHPGTSSPSWPGPASLPHVSQFPQPESPSIVRRIAPGAALVVLAILVTLGSQMYAASSGEVFKHATWIAGLSMLAGVVLIAIRLIPNQKP
jgi:hypothetical protein